MLKQPDRMVIYPQRDSRPDYLLCWIPPRNFVDVSGGNPDLLTELEDFYPTGIETELSQDGLDEFGIIFPYDIDQIRQAYLDLNEFGIFTEIDFVDLRWLEDYLEQKDDPKILDLLDKFSKEEISLSELKKETLFKKMLSEPKSKGEEDPGEAFQKLSGQIEPTDP